MKWASSSVLCVLVYVVNSVLAFPQGNSTTNPPSLFSTALRASRLYDTSLQSSIIRLIRELMLTPKVYESMTNAIERRADSGRVLFPDEYQGRSASMMVASPSGRSLDIAVPATTITPGLRSESLSSRLESGSSTTGGYQNNPLLYEQNGIVRRVRMGKVERVPRPIIINGNYAAMNAPRYNRMVEGPAPTVGGTGTAIKIPPPSVIVSQPLRIIEGNRDSRGRSLKEIDVQGVRVIVGQRVPDDPEDKLFTWRNGRVIKGMFVPNDPSNAKPVEQQVSNEISKPDSLVISSSYDF